MPGSDLIFNVKANTSSAVSGFNKLTASLKPVKKDADAASKSLDKIGKTKISPKVDDAHIRKVQAEIHRLQDEMRHRLSLNVNADTSDIQRKIRGLTSTLRTLRAPVITPTINPSAFRTGLTSAMGGVKKGFLTTASELGNIVGALGPIIGGVGRGIVSIGQAAIGTVGKMLDLADSMERNKLQMNSFTHNMTTTNKLLAQVQKYADTTPFEFPELAAASKMLLGIGMAADKVVPQLKKIGDVAAQSGADVSTLTTIYQQMTSSGKLNAGDMNQLVNAGVSAWPKLAQSMGKTVGQVRKLSEEGKIGGKDIQKFWDTLAKGAKGSTTALAGTFSGMVSTLQDTMNGVLRDIGEAILPFAKVIVPQLTAATEGLGGKIAQQIPGWIDQLAEGAKSLIDFGGQLLQGLALVTNGILNTISGFQQSLGSLTSGLGSMMANLASAVAVIPGMDGIAQSIADAGTGLVTAGEDMKTASQTTADAAVKAGQQWDKWIAAYNKGAAKAKTAIDGAKLKSALVISTGNAQSQVDKIKANLKSLGKQKSTPTVRAKISDARAKLKTAEGWLKQLNKYEANPKLLAQDLASGKVRYVKGQLQSVPKKHDTNLNAKDNTKGPTSSATGNINSVPGKKHTEMTASDGISGPAHNANSAVRNIPTTWHTTWTIQSRRTGASASTGGGPKGPLVPEINMAAAAATPQISVYVRDEKLADLIDIRVNGRAARAAQIIHRRDVMAL